MPKRERSTVLRALAKAKGDLDAVNGSNPRLEKRLKAEITRLQRELVMSDLR
ncbi:MAG: hypothetical protein ACRECH_09430 [Nitrososphaerales archaeon]